MMTHSDQLAELATALAKAQGMMREAKRDETNPAIRNGYRYASLSSVWEACREALSVNGLSVVQSPGYEGDDVVIVQTLLLHTSGQWIASELTMPLEQEGAWGVGSATSYARRYSLAAIVGIASEDDDAALGKTGGGAMGELLEMRCRISEVKLPKRNGKFVTVIANGQDFKTDSQEKIALALAACDTNTEVLLHYQVGKWGNRLLDVSEVGQSEDVPL